MIQIHILGTGDRDGGARRVLRLFLGIDQHRIATLVDDLRFHAMRNGNA